MLLVFVSLLLAGGGVGLFAWLIGRRTFEHTERLWLLPIDDEERVESPDSPGQEK